MMITETTDSSYSNIASSMRLLPTTMGLVVDDALLGGVTAPSSIETAVPAAVSASHSTATTTSASVHLPTDKRKKKWRKPKDKPKRPLSAYNLFFQLERQRLLDEGGSSPDLTKSKSSSPKSSKKYGFASLARHIAAKWKNLEAEDLAYYQQLADQEQVRYMKDLVQWKIHEAKQKYDNDGTPTTDERDTKSESSSIQKPAVCHVDTAPTLTACQSAAQAIASLPCWAAAATTSTKCSVQEQQYQQQHNLSAVRCVGEGLFGGVFDDGSSNLSSIIQELANEKQQQAETSTATTTVAYQQEILEPLPYTDFAITNTPTVTSIADIFQRVSAMAIPPPSFLPTATSFTATVEPIPIQTLPPHSPSPSPSLQQLSLDLDEDEQDFLIAFLSDS